MTNDPDIVILGADADPSPTRGAGVARPDWDSSLRVRPAPVDALPSTYTRPVPAISPMASIPPGRQPTPRTVTANDRGTGPSKPYLSRSATAVVSLVLALVLGVAGLVLVDLSGLDVDDGRNAIGFVATVAAGACGLLLVVASLIGTGETTR